MTLAGPGDPALLGGRIQAKECAPCASSKTQLSEQAGLCELACGRTLGKGTGFFQGHANTDFGGCHKGSGLV